MTSQLDVTKLALQALDERFDNVTATDDDLPGVEQITLVFDDEFDMLIVEHPWTFAMRWRELDEISGDPDLPPHWSGALPYPDDAKKVWEVMNPLGRDYPSLPFKVGFLANSRKVIFQNGGDEVSVGFTLDGLTIEDAGPFFVKALANRLAARVCMAVTSSTSLKDALDKTAELLVLKAASEEANEGVDVDRDRDPDWIRARG